MGGANAGGAQGGTAGAAGAGTAGAGGGDNQLPPTSAAALEAWLAAGHYKAWACQPAPHPANPPGAHGANRICSNAKLSGAGEAGAFPESSANVKEVWDKPGGKIVGYAVYVKTKPTSDGGANLWWYERIGTSVYANGFGDSGGAKTICVDCHKTASTTFAPTSRDFVFTQVK